MPSFGQDDIFISDDSIMFSLYISISYDYEGTVYCATCSNKRSLTGSSLSNDGLSTSNLDETD